MVNLFLLSQSFPLIVVVVFFMLIVFISLYFFYIYKKEKEFEDKESETINNYNSVLLRAHKRARAIIRSASDAAKNLIVSTSVVKEEAIKEVDKNLEEVSKQSKESLSKEGEAILSAYETSLEGIKHESLDSITKISNAIQHATQLELDTFRDALQKELVATQLMEEKKMTEEFEKAKTEISAYKKQKMQEVDQQIEKIVVRAAERVLARTLTLDDHEKIIMDVLDEAQAEGFFDM